VLTNIHNLQSRFTAELLAVLLFILISIGAMVDFAFLPSLPDNIRAILGRPPSGNMIGAALILYVFSAIILILSRMMTGSGKHGTINHAGYLTGFYFFYHFSGKLPENFWAVFVAGITVMALDAYHLWIYCSEELEKEKGRLAHLNRNAADHGEEKN
jgi:hypothetical protein